MQILATKVVVGKETNECMMRGDGNGRRESSTVGYGKAKCNVEGLSLMK
jgi:hypothetical protein